MPTSMPSGKTARSSKNTSVGVVVAEGMLGLEVQRGRRSRPPGRASASSTLAQQVVAAEEELDRLGQFVDQVALGVFEAPGQADDAGGRDQHRKMIAQSLAMNPIDIDAADAPARRPVARARSCAATGRRSRCWCGRPCRGAAPPSAAPRCSRWPRATTSSRACRARRRALVAAPRARSRGARCRRWRSRGWTLLVQGLDLHVDAAHELLTRFRFVPDARLDDLMLSYASDGGGVGPHLDSYDVFLLQVAGPAALAHRPRAAARAAPGRAAEDPGATSSAEQEWLLEPGDMLYLPPGWAHDGVAEGECMTCSIGFRAPARGELGARACCSARSTTIEATPSDAALPRSARRRRPTTPGRIPAALQRFARRRGARAALPSRRRSTCALGEVLSEPKPQRLVRRRRARRDAARGRARSTAAPACSTTTRHVFINGESFRAGGRDAHTDAASGRPAPPRRAASWRALSADARELLDEWAARRLAARRRRRSERR